MRIMLMLLMILPGLAMADAETGVETGKELYAKLCQSCHGPNGDGNGPLAETMMMKPRPFAQAAFKFDTDADWEKGTDVDLANVIRDGTGAYGGSTLMPPWGHLSDEEVASLVSYIRSLEE